MQCKGKQCKENKEIQKATKTKAKQNKSKHIKGKQSNEIAVHRKQPSRGLTYGWELTIGSIDARTSLYPLSIVHPGFPFFSAFFRLNRQAIRTRTLAHIRSNPSCLAREAFGSSRLSTRCREMEANFAKLEL